MARETAENYVWMLRKFVQMNNDCEPTTILTDFDASMCAAIESVFSTKT